MSEIDEKPIPYPDRDSEPYWQALSQGRFELQRCDACESLRWPPRAICNRCHSFDATWCEVPRNGRIVAWTRTHQVFAPAFRDEVPYLNVQVALDEQDDILMIGGWCGEGDPRAGQPVHMKLLDAPGGFKLPFWEPV